MKKIISRLFALSALAVILASCAKDENQVVYEGGTAPVLKANAAGPFTFLKVNKDLDAITFSWTNPNYMFNTGVSSQNVYYILQFDSTGKNFASGKTQEMSIPSDLAVTLKVKDFNSFLSKMEFKAGVQQSVDVRVKATLINNTVPLYSNTLTFKVTPYLDFAVEPPGTEAGQYLDGNLWAVGNALASGWSNPLPTPYDVTQKFTRVDVLHYEATIAFVGGGGYKLIQTQGVWGTQYHALDGSASAALSGSFEKKDSDPQFPGPDAGNYKVQVNFQTGKYTLTKL